MDEIELTALHEAAHVVLAHYHGIPLNFAEVKSDRGRVELAESPLTNHANNYRNYVQFYVAGIAYEERLGPIKYFDMLRADYAMIEEELYWWGEGDKNVEIRIAKTRALKALKECERKHKMIAARLIEHGRLTGNQLMSLWLNGYIV